MKIGVLASGSGSNLAALIAAGSRGELGPGRIAVVIGNVPGCGALDKARAAGLPAILINHRDFEARPDFDDALVAALRAHDVELVALAGFMRLLTPTFLGEFPNRVVNIHPALLPAFPGIDAQRQAHAAGAKIAGCTVHFVIEAMDAGAIIAQTAVPALESDDEEALRLRILAEEHVLYAAALRAIAEGRVTIQEGRVRVAGAVPSSPAALRSIA